MPAKTLFHDFKKGLEILNCKQFRVVAKPISGFQKVPLKSVCKYLKLFRTQDFRISPLRGRHDLKSPTTRGPGFGPKLRPRNSANGLKASKIHKWLKLLKWINS